MSKFAKIEKYNIDGQAVCDVCLWSDDDEALEAAEAHTLATGHDVTVDLSVGFKLADTVS